MRQDCFFDDGDVRVTAKGVELKEESRTIPVKAICYTVLRTHNLTSSAFGYLFIFLLFPICLFCTCLCSVCGGSSPDGGEVGIAGIALVISVVVFIFGFHLVLASSYSLLVYTNPESEITEQNGATIQVVLNTGDGKKARAVQAGILSAAERLVKNSTFKPSSAPKEEEWTICSSCEKLCPAHSGESHPDWLHLGTGLALSAIGIAIGGWTNTVAQQGYSQMLSTPWKTPHYCSNCGEQAQYRAVTIEEWRQSFCRAEED